MKILLINQTFYPDVVATAQYLTSLGEALVSAGHRVTVISSRRGYDAPQTCFPPSETYRGIRIERVRGSGLGKGAKWKRVLDFGTFLIRAAWRLAFARRVDVVLALTSPPLVAVLAALRKRLRGGRFVYWVMDLNPEEALAAGWLRPGRIAGALSAISDFTFRNADAVVVLDRFMRDRILGKGIPPERIFVLPPWSLDSYVRFDPQGRDRFRQEHRLEGKFVIMYSGNHSPCHPLETLVQAAAFFRDDDRFRFVFVGGGSEFSRVREKAATLGLRNVLCLPYQPLGRLSASLSAADLQVIVMGEPFVGLIHPSKFYNILAVNAPVLYIGPDQSHVMDALGSTGSLTAYLHVCSGNLEQLTQGLSAAIARWPPGAPRDLNPIPDAFRAAKLLPEFVAIVEGRRSPQHS